MRFQSKSLDAVKAFAKQHVCAIEAGGQAELSSYTEPDSPCKELILITEDTEVSAFMHCLVTMFSCSEADNAAGPRLGLPRFAA